VSSVGSVEGGRLSSAGADGPRRVREALDCAGYAGPAIARTFGVTGLRALDGMSGPVLVRRVGGDTPLERLIRLLLLGVEVECDALRAALHPTPLEAWEALGLIETSLDVARAMYRIVPHDELLVVSDWPASPGRPLRPDHVLGPSPSASLLAGATVRLPIDSVLDLGTGCGIQALLATRHARRVVATDLNRRAVEVAAFNAALNDVGVEGAIGDLFEPVRGRHFDLVVSNPPFVISPGTRFLFRDSELGGEGISRRIIAGVGELLSERGFCQLTTNWAVIDGVDWRERIELAFGGSGCNAWVLALDVTEPDVYASRWIQQSERTPEAVGAALDEWMRYYESEQIVGIATCMVTMRRARGARPWFHLDEVRGAPTGEQVLRSFEARELLADLDDEGLLELRPRVAPETRLEQQFAPGSGGWTPLGGTLRSAAGVEQPVDSHVANLLVACDGTLSAREVLVRAAAKAGVPADSLIRQGIAVITQLLRAGFLMAGHQPEPPGSGR
jgi:Methyltransferase small domain